MTPHIWTFSKEKKNFDWWPSILIKNFFVFFFQLSGLLSEKYVIKACLSHGKRIIPRNDDGYPYRKLSDQKSGNSRSWENRDRERISLLDTNNREFGEFDLDQDLDGIEDDTEDIEEAALCPGGRLLRLNVSATERTPQ